MTFLMLGAMKIPMDNLDAAASSAAAPNSDIRPLAAADVPAVADLFQRIFVKNGKPAPAALTGYMRSLFLSPPEYQPDIASKVYVRPDGQLTGFIGVVPLPMTFKSKRLRAAVCGPLMVDGHAADPLAGARLLRAFLAGPQDISLSETANPVSVAMWRNLRGTVLPTYSLEWLFVLRPAGFGAQLAAGSSTTGRILGSLAKPVDAVVGRLTATSADAIKAGIHNDAEIDDAGSMDLIAKFTSAFDLCPSWSPEILQRILHDASLKPQFGTLTRRIVRARGGTPIGLFLYHGGPGRIARVLQVLHAPGQAGSILDRMVANIAASGAVGLRLRVQPALLHALLGRGGFFLHRASTVVHARDPELVAQFANGNAFFNGLAGETWTRLNGHLFE